MKLPLMLVLAIAALPIAVTSASATAYDFSYAGPGIAASGTITATGDTATGISGLRNGEAITGLLPADAYGFNDNAVFPAAPYLDQSGLGFTASGIDYNVYYYIAVGVYLECNSAANPICSVPGTGESLTSFTLTPAVPEPFSAALLATGLAGIALGRRRRGG
jgi:hypothetical protein